MYVCITDKCRRYIYGIFKHEIDNTKSDECVERERETTIVWE